jgi:hypothetical protein
MFRVAGPKARVPQFASYPVGTQLLSDALAHIPQASEIEVSYDARPLGYPVTLREIVGRRLPRPVLVAVYWNMPRPAPAAVSRHAEPMASWRLYVYPVERRRRHEVRSLLVRKGLPALSEWFCARRTQTWLAKSHRLECVWAPREAALTLRECDR